MRDWLAAAESAYHYKEMLIQARSAKKPEVSPYYHINTMVANYVESLADSGIKAGDRVGILMQSGKGYIYFIWAIARLGAVLVPLNTRLTADELRYQVELARCRLVIADAANEANAIALGIDNCEVRTPSRPGNRKIVRDPFVEEETWMEYLDGEVDRAAVQSIVFTSGTSGKPKAAQITFTNLYASALASKNRLGASPRDRWLCPLPFYHVGGLSIIFRSAIFGSSIVLPESNSIEGIIKALHDSQSTIVSLVPTQLYRMLAAGFEPPPSLRLILLGGAAASPELVRRCIERNLPIALTYGLTECVSQVATATPEQVRAKPGSVGEPLKGTTVRIVDEAGNDLPPGEYGEIVVSGATVMKGYLGQPPTNGTFHTGDIGYLDADGDLWVVQRRSDLIVSGGENIYPSEVEAVLHQHPAVAEAFVVGLPDAEWGQRVAAMVALRPG